MAYPNGINAITPKQDGPDQIIYAAHMNAIRTALLETKVELGDSPKGSAASVQERLAAGLNADGTLKSGFSVASGTITNLAATTVGCQVVGNHNNANPTPLQRVTADNAVAGGNARGTYATDLQSSRTNATQVASGDYSTISGGYKNIASSYGSIIGGGNANTASGYNSTVSGGYGNVASGDYSTISGGCYNVASDYGSTISGGCYNTASGYGSTISGGCYNTASGDSSTVSGGYSNTASGVYSAIAGGYHTKADKYGQHAQASGQFAATGDAQGSVLILRKETTNATQTALNLDGSTLLIGLDEDATYAFEAHVVTRRTDANNESAYFILRWCADRNPGEAAALVGTVDVTVVARDIAAWAATADCSGNDTRILVTGEAAKTIRWVARVIMTEVHG